jgi:glutamyl-tRNA synthetase
MVNDKPVRVRMAPSPTGRTHLGSGRTALYNYLLARQTGGQFILRIEDTDRKRYDPNAEAELIDSFHWMGLDWDEGPDVGGPFAPYRQSERKGIYQEHALELVKVGEAYYCFCSPERLLSLRQEQQKHKQARRVDCGCRSIDPDDAAARVAAGESHVIRFKIPYEGTTTVYDQLRGEITVENRNLDDYIIVKSDGLALYHLAAIVDDHLMDITHVLRGSEWLPTFPLHARIVRAFGWQEPKWVHLSVFLKPSGKGKMSKRDTATMMKDGKSIYLTDLRAMGYLPEAVVNWTALMGWSYDDHTEYLTMPDLIEKFSIARLNPSPAAINFSKLDHFNGLHIRKLDTADLAARLKPFFEAASYQVDEDTLMQVTPLIQERMVTLEDSLSMAGFFFQQEVHPEPQDLIGKKMTIVESATAARCAYDVLVELPQITSESAETPMRALAEELGLKVGQLFGILRVAVTGQRISPPLFESMEVIGRKKTLDRIQNAVTILKEMSKEESL